MSIIGLDIGTSHIKAVDITKKGDSYRLDRFAIVPSNGLAKKIYFDVDSDVDLISTQIKKFFSDNGFTTKKVSVVIPESQVFSKIISMPSLPKGELGEAISLEAGQHLPRPPSEVYLKYIVLSGKYVKEKKKSAKENMQIYLIAITKKVVDKYVEAVRKANLDPIGVEPTSISIVRNILSSSYGSSSIPSMIINFGYSNMDFYYVVDKSLKYVRTIKFGISNVIRAIVRDLDININQASEYLFKYGLHREHLDGKVAKAIYPAIEVLVSEYKKSQKYVESRKIYRSKEGLSKMKRTAFIGGGTLIPGLIVTFATENNIEIHKVNVWSKIDISLIPNSSIEVIGPLFSAAAGAAMQ